MPQLLECCLPVLSPYKHTTPPLLCTLQPSTTHSHTHSHTSSLGDRRAQGMAAGSGGIADEKAPEAFGLSRHTTEAAEEEDGGGESGAKSKLSGLLWHGGSAYDAWFSCASNQVAQVLLTLPYSFAQLGMLSGILFQIFYGVMGSWTAYLISILYLEYRTRKERDKVDFRNHVIQWFEVLDGLLGRHWRNAGLAFNCTFLLFGSVIQLIGCASNIYYVNDRLDKRTWTYIFGACCATTVFIPSFHNYRVWSFLGLVMTTYTAWYIAVASLLNGQVEGVTHSGPTRIVLYFTGATNILYTFGGHAVTVEIMHAMWRPQKFKSIYLLATVYVLTLTLPSASAAYWAFGDALLTHSNALALLPRTRFRDAAVVLMLIHQFITFGFACTPLYFVWEKLIGLHDCRSLCKRAAARLPVVVPIWFLAIIFPFFGPINSAVGSLLVSFTVYIIPALAHMVTFRSPQSRENAVERPPKFAGGWTGAYVINSFVVAWVLVVGFGFGGWASITNFVQQVNSFGLFAKCYQCPPHLAAPPVLLAPPPMAPTPSMPPVMSLNTTGGAGLFPPASAPAPAPSPMMHFFLRHHHHRHHGRHGL
ncbi:auxin transporter-like protein 3 [Phragmites australis]|uniref:auxin transporter-like protein 3 n=1 Tax=Phragmites australis TaxID=29695 RepID=UPI002D7A0F5F|nr:auxin transporter-like protein 3 [Phragmites australis]